jgi:hypothetical protein
MPDFVFRAEQVAVGSGSRELGDGIVIVGDVGLVVQVKCREGSLGDAAKERRWVEKKAADALRQANGTIRLLKRTAQATLTSARGTTITIDGSAIRWIAVVVIDHPDVPDDVLPDIAGPNPAVVLLRRDWEFVFHQLKSTTAVVAYLDRVSDESVPLGEEPSRYYELAQADERAEPGPINPALFGGRGRRSPAPLLPMVPVDESAQRFLRLILEDIAVAGLAQSPEPNRLRVLAELDRLPVGQREDTGRFLADALAHVSRAAPGMTEWKLRQLVGADETALLGFGACSTSASREEIRAAFSGWVQLRHHQLQQVTGKVAELTTVGVLLTPLRAERRKWDTTMVAVAGDLELTEADLRLFESFWKRPEDVVIASP